MKTYPMSKSLRILTNTDKKPDLRYNGRLFSTNMMDKVLYSSDKKGARTYYDV